MGVQKPPLPIHQQGGGGSSNAPPALLKALMLRGHGLVPPTTASALTARPPTAPNAASLAPPLKLRSAPGVEGFANASPQHPLDPLSIQELETAGLLAGRALAASKQHAEPLEAVRLADVALLEPPKARLVTYQGKSLREALAWGMPRMAAATAFSVASGKTYRVLVDLSAGVRF
jgi:Cu2+-containing amine oxidase